MNKQQAFKYSLISVLLIVSGIYISYKIWWTHGDARLLGIISFFLVGFGSLFLSISLTRIIIPTRIDFSISKLSNKKEYEILKRTIGSATVKLINVIYISLFVIFIGGAAYGLVTFTRKYEKEQLMTYGRIQKVRINDVHVKGKGMPYAFINFYLDGKVYSNELSGKKLRTGDSATIIFSTHNTDIVKWSEDFYTNEE